MKINGRFAHHKRQRGRRSLALRIIFVNRFFFPDISATSQMLSDLCFRLAGPDQEISVITSRLLYDNPASVLPRNETINGVHIHRIWTSRFGRKWIVLRAFDYFTFYISAFLFLIVHANNGDVVVAKTDPPLLSVIAWGAAKIRRARLVNWIQDLFPEVAVAIGVQPVIFIKRVLMWARNLSLNAAAMNVVIGHRMAEVVVQAGVNPRRVCVIPNWADGIAIHPIVPGNQIFRDEWGLGGKFVVSYSGNMGRAHDFDTLLEAIQILKDEPDICFLFIGGGAQRGRIERSLRGDESSCGAVKNSNVVFMPYQPREELGQSLAVGDVHYLSLSPKMEGLVVPSKFYGILAAGRPALFVGDSDGEIGRILRGYGLQQDQECGYCLAPGDSEGLAVAIRTLKDDAAHRKRLGDNARKAFDRHYNLSLQVDQWRDVIRTVLDVAV